MENRKPAKSMALGGVMAALAVVIMCMGGLIPLATYVCPMLCMILLKVIHSLCGTRVSWAWYGAVAILSVLLGPDKEAAAVFVFLGYYPIVKPRLDCCRLRWIWKGLLFNAAILSLYWILIHLFGMDQIAGEFHELGTGLLIATLVMGNITFFLLDYVLGKRFRRR